MRSIFQLLLGGAVICTLALPNSAGAQDQVSRLKEIAIQNAVERAASAIVQIETSGGLDRVKGIQLNNGPTTGVIISNDGYVLSSMINFVQRPSSIVVRFSDDELSPAQIVASDHSRKLVLLKVEGRNGLKSIELVPRSQLSVGQTVIACGKVYDARVPNISVGILSALNRIWDCAVQTDAKISPANFGGPLIDLQGRMIGILAPLSPTQSDVVAGSNWYDSGIGFAVPIQDLLDHFEFMSGGNDLRPGRLGVAFKSANIYEAAAEIAVSFDGAPAARAGIEAADIIVELNGRPVRRQTDFKHAIGRFYAGDRVRLTVQRGSAHFEYEVELASEIEPYAAASIGVVLFPSGSSEETVDIRYVLDDSPAARAGMAAGDTIASINGHRVRTREELASALIRSQIGETLKLGIIKSGGRPDQLTIVNIALRPQTAELLPDIKRLASAQSTKTIEIAVSDFPNRCFAILPVDAPVVAGVLVWIPEPGVVDQTHFVDAWKEACLRYNIIVVVPQSDDATKWDPEESEYIAKLLRLLGKQIQFDPQRIAIGGRFSGASMAALVCFKQRETFRGLIMIDNILHSRIENPATSAVHPLLVFVGTTEAFEKRVEVEESVQRLKLAQFPVYLAKVGAVRMNEFGPLILGWVDTLDRL